MSDYTASTDEVNEQRRLTEHWHTLTPTRRAALAAHDATVRAEERERIAQAIKTERESVPMFVLTTEGQRAAWKIGMARAFKIAREGA